MLAEVPLKLIRATYVAHGSFKFSEFIEFRESDKIPRSEKIPHAGSYW